MLFLINLTLYHEQLACQKEKINSIMTNCLIGVKDSQLDLP
jgi:hypothetical protein